MSAPSSRPQALGTRIELRIGAMTCAPRAMRIEKLDTLDGVTATVSHATEKAQVHVSDGVDAASLLAEVQRTGYTATLPPAPTTPERPDEPAPDAQSIQAAAPTAAGRRLTTPPTTPGTTAPSDTPPGRTRHEHPRRRPRAGGAHRHAAPVRTRPA